MSAPKPPHRANLRKTNPILYRSIMTFGVIYVALGCNFLLPFIPAPTFRQFGIPPELIGAGFLAIGLALVFFLNVYRDLRVVRLTLIASMLFDMFWAVGSTETFFHGTASLQLFFLYCGLAALTAPLVLEPFFNPVTGSEEP